MKNKLIIFSNKGIRNFITSVIPNYELTLLNLNEIDLKLHYNQANLIILGNFKDFDLVNFDNLNDNSLIISSFKKNIPNINDKLKLVNAPISIINLKNIIENFIQNLKIKFHDLCIDKEKIINLNDNTFCYLTKVELEILSHLIREKETSKNLIKQNILNIKSNIETNSLESHLTRIRKKMIKINTGVKIQTKGEKLLIIS